MAPHSIFVTLTGIFIYAMGWLTLSIAFDSYNKAMAKKPFAVGSGIARLICAVAALVLFLMGY